MEVTLLTESRSAARPGKVPFVDLTRQHADHADEFQAAIQSVIERSDFALGEEVERFEEEFAAFCGVEHGVGVSSGVEALMLALIAAGIGPGDEVIVPAYGPMATAVAVIHAGATPVLCDVRADTGLIDVASAGELAGERTAAVVAVHLHGQPCDMPELHAFAERFGLVVIEDGSEAHGARFEGARAGSLADVGTFSLEAARNLGSFGDGGVVCTDDAAIAERVRGLRQLGPRGTRGRSIEVGFEAALGGLQAAVLRVKLRHLDAKNTARRAWAQMYRAVLPRQVTTLWEDPRAECVYHLFPIRVTERDRTLKALRRHGIDVGVPHWPALHAQPSLAGHRLPHAGGVRAAEDWSDEEISLPMFPELTVDEVTLVGEVLAAALD
jgi:dTDP-4-amino-4,6-dideoxygalactose transaminase